MVTHPDGGDHRAGSCGGGGGGQIYTYTADADGSYVFKVDAKMEKTFSCRLYQAPL